MNYADKLEALADYLRRRPQLLDKYNDHYDCPREYIYASDWDEFQSLVNCLGGYQKDGYGGNLDATHKEKDQDDDWTFVVRIAVSGVCEQVPKVDENGEPVMKPVTKTVYEETGEMEQEVEWKCPPVWSY